jgi:hypothetical protein
VPKIRGDGKLRNVGGGRTTLKLKRWHGESPSEPTNRRQRRIKAKLVKKTQFDAGAGHGPDFDFRGEPPEFTEHFYGYGHKGD